MTGDLLVGMLLSLGGAQLALIGWLVREILRMRECMTSLRTRMDMALTQLNDHETRLRGVENS